MADGIEPREALENAAQLFTNRGLYRSAVVLYCKLLAGEPNHGMAWTGLAEALLRLSALETNTSLLELSLRCVRRCLVVDESNFWAERLHGTIQACSSLPRERFATCKPLEGDDPTGLLHQELGLSNDRLTADFDQISWEERMLIVVWLGALRDSSFVELLLRASRDENSQVKLAALQPLARWASQPEVRAGLEAVSRSQPEQQIAAELKRALAEVRVRFPEHGSWADSLTQELADGQP